MSLLLSATTLQRRSQNFAEHVLSDLQRLAYSNIDRGFCGREGVKTTLMTRSRRGQRRDNFILVPRRPRLSQPTAKRTVFSLSGLHFIPLGRGV